MLFRSGLGHLSAEKLQDWFHGLAMGAINFEGDPAKQAANDATAAEIDRFRATGKEAYSVGYDYFLMSGDVLDDFADGPFCLGMPFWDYWLPLMALLKGRPLKALQSPVALHVAHETRWDDTIYLFFHALIASVIETSKASRGRGPTPEEIGRAHV